MAEPTPAGPPPVVGRERELEVLTTLAAHARDGRGALVVLSGPPGAGRTRLAAALCDRAVAQGLRPVWSHAPPDSGASPLAPWVEIVRGAIGDTEIAELTAGLDGVAAVQALGLVPDLIPVGLAPVGDPPPDRLALFDGTAHLLRNLARDQPLVVVLDDFDAAGIASLRFLEFLVPELRETPMLVVSIWPESAPSSLDGDAHRLVLSPLEAGESARQHRAPAHDVDPGASVSRAERAGDNALAELAWEDAAGHYRRALAVLTATDATDAPEADDDRARLLLAAGRALLSAGDAGGGRSAYDEAADLARRRGRPDDLARAALGLSATLEAFDPSPLDPAARPLLEEASAALGPGHPALRARVGARLSMALGTAGPPEPGRRRELSDDAVALARRLDDDEALVAALVSRCDARAGPTDRQMRLDDADEIVTLADASGDVERELVGRRLRVVALLEGGDVVAVDAEIAAFTSVTERLGQPRLSWIVALWESMRALLQGRFAECERRNSEAATLGRRGGAARVGSLATVQFFGLRVAQDRLVELEAPARALAERPGDRAGSGASLACLLGLRGRDGEACAELARLAHDRFGSLGADDPRWLAALAVLAELAATLDRRPEATVLYELLLPYARFLAVEAMGSVCHGSVSRHLGLLAHALGRWDDADIHFGHALDDNTSAGAPLLVAHTRSQWSALRRARDVDADWEQGLDLLIGAEAIYRRLGVDRLADEARRVLARSHEPAASERSSAGNAFRREGDRWLLSYGRVQVRVADSLGMHDLAAFVANPGRSFHVVDLAAGVFGGGVGQAGQRPRTVPGTAGDRTPQPQPDIDALARAEYRVRLAELDDMGATADPVRVSLARAERDFIEAELADADRPAPTATDPVERARRAVASRIRLSLDRIDDAHPALGRHLRHSVRTGMFCSYEPEIPTNWAAAKHDAGSG